MLTKGGTGRQMSVQAKLLDFGLAKLLEPGGAVSSGRHRRGWHRSPARG